MKPGLEPAAGRRQSPRVTNMKSPGHVWRWVRHASARHEDSWRERLSLFGAALAIHGKPGAKMIRIEVYSPGAAERKALVRDYGGTAERIDASSIVAAANTPRRPRRLGSGIGILDAVGTWPEGSRPPRILLRIGGAMAFGTGEHATTAACLRWLQEIAPGLPAGWTALDIGTGTGILAAAAEKLGATHVTAFDNDPRAVRAARANLKLNRCRRVRLAQGDLLSWHPGHDNHAVVLANVYSEILRAGAPALRDAVAPGGWLIVSGILRGQETGVARTFRQLGLQPARQNRRGKWVTLAWRAPEKPPVKVRRGSP